MQVVNKSIAIVAGEGDLPFSIKDALNNQGWSVFILAYHGITPEHLIKDTSHAWLYLGQVQKAVEILQHHCIKHIVLVGKFYRPKLINLRLDTLGRKLLYRLGVNWFGDNALLTALLEFIQEQGLVLVKIQDIIPGLLTQKGRIGTRSPNLHALEDIEKGIKILKDLSCWDVGQGLAIQGKRVLGIEAAEGTDACITRCGLLAEQGGLTPKPVYVKMAKVGQSRAIDLPVIGFDTVDALYKAGFQGMGIEAHSVLVLDLPALERAIQEREVFLWKF
ncbi:MULTISPECIES: LpxI family protein [Holospora]|uniref:DUF1009 domain-containing protein n=2 Tax=Holospora TaxID=44747 RepID=A0A061JIF9_9PROT|nr:MULTISPECIES: UDP-2,3-diacylglucosamine diphosphatase LpxI [Holospora]ETZ05442.1 hypothetical protein K737_300123 [Holospora undulata HU1]GAJ46392.1 hypothetical protein HE1_00725 [Holospora elegans E1]